MASSSRSFVVLLALLGGVGAPPAVSAAADAATANTSGGARAAEEIAGVAGSVATAARPLAAARIYLYRLGDGSVEKALTDETGSFLFAGLPAGLYKVIVHKAGFVPTVVRLTRATSQARQFLDLELVAEPHIESTSEEDFWSMRAQIPPDVLRDIQVAEIADAARLAGSGLAPLQAVSSGRVLAEMRAMTGVDRSIGGDDGHVTRGGVGVEGQVGSLRLGLDGDYWQLQPVAGAAATGSSGITGEASALSLELAGEGDTRVQLTSQSNRLVDPRHGEALPLDVDFEHYRLSVSHAIGERGRSDFSAQYTSENNFYRRGPVAPLAVPDQSRSWRVEGIYTTDLDERSSLQAGVRYRHRVSAHDGVPMPGGLGFAGPLEQEQVDLFGRAGTRIGGSVLVEYGLYTGLRDGSLSLSPRGGLVLQLAPQWQAEVTAAHKVHDESAEGYRHFTPSFLAPHLTTDPCADNEQSCYRLLLSQDDENGETFVIGASHREFDEVQRLDFSDDLTDRHDGLYLVPGDQLPEIEMAISRRLTPRVLARWQSNLASGGGGVFYATDRSSYENSVRYLVTSVDTHFDGTSTGLFVAFHHLQQDLEALGPQLVAKARQMEVERLELMLTQDLNILLGLATDMAVQLNMQVSRGAAAADDDDQLRRRLMGGIALRF